MNLKKISQKHPKSNMNLAKFTFNHSIQSNLKNMKYLSNIHPSKFKPVNSLHPYTTTKIIFSYSFELEKKNKPDSSLNAWITEQNSQKRDNSPSIKTVLLFLHVFKPWSPIFTQTSTKNRNLTTGILKISLSTTQF